MKVSDNESINTTCPRKIDTERNLSVRATC